MTQFGAQLWCQQTSWAGVPRHGAPGGGRRLGLRLDVGPPPRDLRAVGAADLRGLDHARRHGRGHEADQGRADGRGEHVPRPGADREARDDASTTSATAGRSWASAGPGSSASTRRSGSRPGAPASASGSTGSTSRSGSSGGCSTASGSAIDGTFYDLEDALAEPRPIQAHLPILIGGSGPKKTLRTTARYADAWNTSGTLDEVRQRLDILRGHCDDVGRRLRGDRADDQLPDHPPRRRGRRRGGLRGDARRQRHAGHGRRADAPRQPVARRRRHPAVRGPRLLDRHRPAARRRTTSRRSTGCRRSRSCSAASERWAVADGGRAGSSCSPAGSAGRSWRTGCRPISAIG